MIFDMFNGNFTVTDIKIREIISAGIRSQWRAAKGG